MGGISARRTPLGGDFIGCTEGIHAHNSFGAGFEASTFFTNTIHFQSHKLLLPSVHMTIRVSTYYRSPFRIQHRVTNIP